MAGTGPRSDPGSVPAQPGRLSNLEADPTYLRLLRERSRFSWTLTAIMLVIFFGYILLIAFNRDWLAQPIGGGTTTLGIPIGIGVILAGIALTAVYVHRANSRFDPLIKDIVERHEG